eukprot:1835289-Rhodomonas_salina.5
MQQLQREKLQPDTLSGKRALICKTFGGMGNRSASLTGSCPLGMPCLRFATSLAISLFPPSVHSQ